MLLQARRHQGLPPTTRSWDKTERILSRVPRRVQPNDTLISDFPRPELWENKLLLSKPPSLRFTGTLPQHVNTPGAG